ncbi:LamB/YcsF family protein [Streptomyces sp. 5-10]|uniref:LamB/YcsF family protein n=1 Tax=Streptomyces sp. 5-10 TaxID=878925 RepID=UPI001CC32EC3|nr:5-oxoprolinase subunit PxpA [Streptomyces sp. 5-10]
MKQHMVDLVADLGEGFGAYTMGDDEALLDVLTSANIACGFHAGDPRIMDATVRHCVRRGVAVGAHPSFPDLVGFGRRAMDLTPDEVRTDTLYQIGALRAFATAHHTQVRHVAPHGRLGNLVATRPDYAEAVADAVASLDRSLVVLAQDGALADAAHARDLRVGIVGVADRAYRDDGTLVPRSEPGAVIHDPGEIAERTVRMVTEGVVRTVGGRDLPVECDTVLLHGDTPGAITLAHRIRRELLAAGVRIAPLTDVLDAKAREATTGDTRTGDANAGDAKTGVSA